MPDCLHSSYEEDGALILFVVFIGLHIVKGWIMAHTEEYAQRSQNRRPCRADRFESAVYLICLLESQYLVLSQDLPRITTATFISIATVCHVETFYHGFKLCIPVTE